MPGKVVAARRRESVPRRFRRPSSDDVRSAAIELLRRQSRPFPSQTAFTQALVRQLRRTDPRIVLSGTRLRQLIFGAPGVALRVRYAERRTGTPPTICPVCRSPLRPISNRTLDGDPVTIGYACTRCDYWTHRRPRVPIRYLYGRAGRRSTIRTG
jgi:hypothetical protein